MAKFLENGLDSTGDDVLDGEIITTGVVIWVDSVAGNDSNAGTKEAPLATLAAAHSAATAANGDIIVIKSGHTETLTSSITISKAGTKIYGLGSGSSAPNFICNAAIDCIDITGANVEINNLYFPAATTATATALINVIGMFVQGCTFDGSTYNWDDGAIYSAVAHTSFHYDSITLSNNAKIKHTAAAKGVLFGTVCDESSEVSLA